MHAYYNTIISYNNNIMVHAHEYMCAHVHTFKVACTGGLVHKCMCMALCSTYTHILLYARNCVCIAICFHVCMLNFARVCLYNIIYSMCSQCVCV